jgi:hypothetical protein
LGDDEEQLEEAPAPRARRRWRVLGLLVIVAFASWTLATIVNILAEGTPDRESRGAGPAQRSRQGRVTIAAVGNIGSDKAGVATIDKMAQSRPDVYVALGDLSQAGPGTEAEWCEGVRSRIGPVAPFEIVAGNLEDEGGHGGRIPSFEACLPDRLNAVGRYGREYYFDLGKLVRFILISPDLTIDGTHYSYARGSPSSAWLVDAIDGARARGIRWVIVGTHRHCMSVPEYDCAAHQDLLSLLIEKRVDLVVHGDGATYQRSKQLSGPRDGCDTVIVQSFDPDCVVRDGSRARHRQGAGTTFVVSGAGSGELAAVEGNAPAAGYLDVIMGANRRGRHGFAMFDITPSTLAVKFVGSTPGSFTDEFQIVRRSQLARDR